MASNTSHSPILYVPPRTAQRHDGLDGGRRACQPGKALRSGLAIAALLCWTADSALAQETTDSKTPTAGAPAPGKRQQPPPTKPARAKARKADAAQGTADEQPVPSGPDEGCFPQCRDGHLCHEGQCILACNPPCPEGEQCTGKGQCRAKPPLAELEAPTEPPPSVYYPWPPTPPQEVHQRPAWEPVFPEPESYQGRQRQLIGMIGLQLSLGGSGKVEDDGDFGGFDDRFNLEAGAGLEAALEFRLDRHFGLAPGLRMFYTRAGDDVDRSTNLDLLVIPTFHLPLDRAELILPIPVGVSFGSLPYDLPSGDSGGVTLGFTPGVIAWLRPDFGIYTQLGFTWHFRRYDWRSADYVYYFVRPVLTIGAAIGG